MQILALVSALAASVIAFPSPKAIQFAGSDPLNGFKVCGTGEFAITGLNYSPNPIVAGQNVVIELIGTASANITAGAKIQVNAVAFGFINVLSTTIDICTSNGVSCPIPAGAEDVKLSIAIPSSAPSITVDLTAKATNGDGSALVCVENKNLKV